MNFTTLMLMPPTFTPQESHRMFKILKVLWKVTILLRKWGLVNKEVCKHYEAYLRGSLQSHRHFKDTNFPLFSRRGMQPYITWRATWTCYEIGWCVVKLDNQHHFTSYFEFLVSRSILDHVDRWHILLGGVFNIYLQIFQVGDVLGIDWLYVKPLLCLSISTKVLMYLVRSFFFSIMSTI